MRSHAHPTRIGRLRRGLAVGTALALLAACGGDDDAEVAVEDAADELSAEAEDAADEAEEQSAELAARLRDNGLTSVASAVELVDFSELVDAPSFTFFAPNDEAFQTLTADELADLLSDPAAVADVLRNHTVADEVASTDLSDGMEIVTEAGGTLVVSIDGDTVMIGEATVVEADVDVNDGVVHVVDRLLLP